LPRVISSFLKTVTISPGAFFFTQRE
jgi:hypothetical protein